MLFADGASFSDPDTTAFPRPCGLRYSGTSCMMGSWSISPLNGASSSAFSLGGRLNRASWAREAASLSTMGAGGHDRRLWTTERAVLWDLLAGS
jgi:hypothetical protein